MASRWVGGCAAAIAVVGIAASIAAYLLWPTPPPHYETATVERGRVVANVTATGTLSALVTVQVGSQVSGRIASLDADFNSEVQKDQTIATIDPAAYEAALEQSRANHAVAKANRDKARVQADDAKRLYERAQALADRQLIAGQDVDTAKTTWQAAEATVRAADASILQAQAALHQAEVNLAYTDIRSPVHGVVIQRNVDVGQTVAASLAAPTLFVIAEDLGKMQVDTSVAEADIARLTKDMKATFTVDAWPGRKFEGSIRQVRNAPTTVQNVVTYDAVVDVDNADLALKPGMTANVTFTWDHRDDVLTIPNVALRFHPPDAKPVRGEGKQRTVYALRDGELVPVAIEVGLTDGRVTEVVSGELAEGEAVVTDLSTGATPGSGGGGGGGGNSPFRRF
jgi:HlyD family secretion protein